MPANHADVLIVGARCAGAATARLLAQAGLRVLVVDAAARGSDTLSSHVLTRGAIRQLHRWDLLGRVLAAGTPRVAATEFQFAGQGGKRIAFDAAPGLPGILAPRRHMLDRILGDAAAGAGAEIRYRTAMIDVLRDGDGRVRGARLCGPEGREYEVGAALTIGADGLRSATARRIGAAVYARDPDCLGHVYGYVPGVASDDNRGFFAAGVSVAVTPTNGGVHCVIASAAPDVLRAELCRGGADRALLSLARKASPTLGDELSDSRLAEPARAFAGAPGQYRRSAGPGWALVGDAGYFRDPVTSHGITDAFRDAELLAEAVLAGSDAALAAYQRDRDAASAEIFGLTGRIVRADMNPVALSGLFRDLSHAMRREQGWMADRFAPAARAAA